MASLCDTVNLCSAPGGAAYGDYGQSASMCGRPESGSTTAESGEAPATRSTLRWAMKLSDFTPNEAPAASEEFRFLAKFVRETEEREAIFGKPPETGSEMGADVPKDEL